MKGEDRGEAISLQWRDWKQPTNCQIQSERDNSGDNSENTLLLKASAEDAGPFIACTVALLGRRVTNEDRREIKRKREGKGGGGGMLCAERPVFGFDDEQQKFLKLQKRAFSSAGLLPLSPPCSL